MPTLSSSSQNIQRFILPSTQDESIENQAWVELDTSPLLAVDMLAVADFENQMATSFQLLSARIKAWNYEENGVPTEINSDTIGRLDMLDFSFLIDKLGDKLNTQQLTTIEKKN